MASHSVNLTVEKAGIYTLAIGTQPIRRSRCYEARLLRERNQVGITVQVLAGLQVQRIDEVQAKHATVKFKPRRPAASYVGAHMALIV